MRTKGISQLSIILYLKMGQIILLMERDIGGQTVEYHIGYKGRDTEAEIVHKLRDIEGFIILKKDRLYKW